MAAGPPVSKRPRDGCGAAATGEVVGQAPGTSPSPPPWDALGRHHRPASFVCVAAAVDEQRGGRETAALNEAGRRRGGDAGRFATPALPPLQRTRSPAGRRGRGRGATARGQGCGRLLGPLRADKAALQPRSRPPPARPQPTSASPAVVDEKLFFLRLLLLQPLLLSCSC